MKYARSITILIFWLGAITALILTHDWPKAVPLRPGLIDLRLFRTAGYMAQTAANTDETEFAEQIVTDADHELDLAFAQALKDAERNPVVLSPEAKMLQARLVAVQKRLHSDQEQLSGLTSKAQQAPDSQKEAIQQNILLLQAQIALDQDDVLDAQDDLARASGDVRSRIQTLFEQHQRAEEHHKSGSVGAAANSAEASYHSRNLIDQLSAWYALRSKKNSLLQALDEARAGVAQLQSLNAKAEYDLLQTPAPAVVPQPVEAGGKPVAPSSPQQLAAIQNFQFLKKRAETLQRRIDDRRDIGGTYANWVFLITSNQRIALVGVLRSLLWIVVIVAGSYLAFSLFSRLTANAPPDNKRQTNLRITGRFILQAGAVLLVLVVIFGVPQQLPTALFGIIGAGLTVAIKNFASSFVDSRLKGLIQAEESKATTPGTATAT